MLVYTSSECDSIFYRLIQERRHLRLKVYLWKMKPANPCPPGDLCCVKYDRLTSQAVDGRLL